MKAPLAAALALLTGSIALGRDADAAATFDSIHGRTARLGVRMLPSQQEATDRWESVRYVGKPIRTIKRSEAPVWAPKVNTEHEWNPGERKSPAERNREEEKEPAAQEANSQPKLDGPIPIRRQLQAEKDGGDPQADSTTRDSQSPAKDTAEAEDKNAPLEAKSVPAPKPDFQSSQHTEGSISLSLAGFSAVGYFAWLFWSRLRIKRKAASTPQVQGEDDTW